MQTFQVCVQRRAKRSVVPFKRIHNDRWRFIFWLAFVCRANNLFFHSALSDVVFGGRENRKLRMRQTKKNVSNAHWWLLCSSTVGGGNQFCFDKASAKGGMTRGKAHINNPFGGQLLRQGTDKIAFVEVVRK